MWTVTFPTAESFQTKNYSHEFKAINVTLGFSFSPSASYFCNAHDSQHPNPCVKCVQGNANLCIWGTNEIVSFLNVMKPPLLFRKVFVELI